MRYILFLLPLLLCHCAPQPPVKTANFCYVVLHDAHIFGGCWDTGCNLPDPYVRIATGNDEIWRSKTVHNALKPAWHQVSSLVTPGQLLRARVELLDNDGKDAQVIAAWDIKQSMIMIETNDTVDVLSTRDGKAHVALAIKCEGR